MIALNYGDDFECGKHNINEVLFFVQVNFQVIRSEILVDKIPVFFEVFYDPISSEIPYTQKQEELLFTYSGLSKLVHNDTTNMNLITNIDPIMTSLEYLLQGSIASIAKPVDTLVIRNFGSLSTVLYQDDQFNGIKQMSNVKCDLEKNSENCVNSLQTPLPPAQTLDFLPMCTVNGISMNVTIVDNIWGNQDFIIAIPDNYIAPIAHHGPITAILNDNDKLHTEYHQNEKKFKKEMKYKAPIKLSRLQTDINNHIGDGSGDNMADNNVNDFVDHRYIFQPSEELYIDCNLRHFITPTKFGIAFTITMMGPDIAPQNGRNFNQNGLPGANDLPSGGDNSPTLSFSPYQYNLASFNVPVKQFKNFKKISLPRFYPVLAQRFFDNFGNFEHNSGKIPPQQLNTNVSPVPTTMNRYKRQLLIPNSFNDIQPEPQIFEKMLKDENKIKNKYNSFFQFSYLLTGDITSWSRNDEFFSFELHSLPIESSLIHVKYVLYGFDVYNYNPENDNSTHFQNSQHNPQNPQNPHNSQTPGNSSDPIILTDYTSRHVIARGLVPSASLKKQTLTNTFNTDPLPSTSSLRIKNFLPSLLAQNRMHPFSDQTHGEIQFFVFFEHFNIPHDTLIKYPEPYPHARIRNTIKPLPLRPNLPSNSHLNDTLYTFDGTEYPIEPHAVVQLYQYGNRSKNRKDGHDDDDDDDDDKPEVSDFSNKLLYKNTNTYSLFSTMDSFIATPIKHTEAVNETNPDTFGLWSTMGWIWGNFDMNNSNLVSNNHLLNEIDVITQRYYTLNLTFSNITTPTPISSFFLSLPTADYSFIGNLTGCMINNELVEIVPIGGKRDEFKQGLIYTSQALKFSAKAKNNQNDDKIKETNFIFPSETYHLFCPESLYLKPTILLGIHETLFNNYVPLLISTQNPLLGHGDRINIINNDNNHNNDSDLNYIAYTFIKFNDFILPSLFFRVLGLILIFSTIFGILIFIYLVTKSFCQIVPSEVVIPDPIIIDPITNANNSPNSYERLH
jgi:hypothetical protein